MSPYPDDHQEQQPDKPEPVYCKDCEHFKRGWPAIVSEKCIHPHNWKPTWHNPVREDPWEINKHNNCNWFKRKRSAKLGY